MYTNVFTNAFVCSSAGSHASLLTLNFSGDDLTSKIKGKSSSWLRGPFSVEQKVTSLSPCPGHLRIIAGRSKVPSGHWDGPLFPPVSPLSGIASSPLVNNIDAAHSTAQGASFYATSYVDELDVYRGLVLDTTYRPINVVCWKRALVLQILEKADVLQYYDQVVRSPNQVWPLPAVLRISNFVHSPKDKKRKLSLSRNNIFLRDKFTCQYCGSKDNLTIDHVKALSRGGGSSWENLVTACSPCNLKKGDKSPIEAGMRLTKKPREPKELDSRELPPNYKTYRSLKRHARTPAEWLDWLPLKRPDFY